MDSHRERQEASILNAFQRILYVNDPRWTGSWEKWYENMKAIETDGNDNYLVD